MSLGNAGLIGNSNKLVAGEMGRVLAVNASGKKWKSYFR